MTRVRPVIVAWVLGALAGAAALVLFYGIKPAIVLDMGSDLSSLARGFHHVEQGPDGRTYAWTTERAELHLPGLDRRAPWTATLRLRGARANLQDLPEVRLSVDGEVRSTRATTNEWEEISAEVPVSDSDRGAVITLSVSKTFVPGGGDPRTLGVMVDELRVTPTSIALPPRRTLGGAMIATAAYGAALAAIGLTTIVAVAASVLLGIGQAVVMSRGLGPYEPYGGDLAWFAAVIALLVVVGVAIAERVTRRPFRNTARFVVAFTAAALFLKLAALLHPSMPIGDGLFHAHRLEWVLNGRLFFTSVAPGGYQFPYAIALYVLAAPFTLVVSGLPAYVDLLRTVVAVADALAGLLVYLMIVRVSGDRLGGAIAAGLYHLVPLNYQVQVTGNLTNAFGQSVFFATLALVALGVVRAGSRRGLAVGVAAATVAALAHTSTFAILVPALAAIAVLFAWRGGPVLRPSARSLAWVLLGSVALAVGLYYAHFLETYTAQFARIGSEIGRPVAQIDPGGRTLAGRFLLVPHNLVTFYGVPAMMLAGAGATWLARRHQRDRLTLVLAGWAAVSAAFLVLGVLTPVDMRYYLAFFPAVALLGGVGASWWWRRGGWWQASAGVLLLLTIARAVWEWLRPLMGWGY